MQDSGARGKVEAMHLDLSSFRSGHMHILSPGLTAWYCLCAVEAEEMLACPSARRNVLQHKVHSMSRLALASEKEEGVVILDCSCMYNYWKQSVG